MAAGTDTAFKIRNTLIVNTAFSVNATGIYFSNTLALNSTFYAGQSAFVNTAGNFNISGNVTLNAALVVSGSSGDPGQALLSANTSTYWSTLAASAFTNTTNATNITTGQMSYARISGLATSATTDTTNAANITTGVLDVARIPSLSVYQTTAGLASNVAPLAANNASYLGTVAAASYQQTGTPLTNNVATMSANNSSYLGTVAAASYQQSGTPLTNNVATMSANNSTYTAGFLPIKVQRITASSSSLSIDLSLGQYIILTLSATVSTMTITNWSNNTIIKCILDVRSTGAFNITNWGGAKWASGTTPTVTSGNGKKDLYVLASADGGTTIHGGIGGQNYS